MKVTIREYRFPSPRAEGEWHARYEAALDGTRLSATGASPAEAVGKLVMLHARQFQFEFKAVNVGDDSARTRPA